MVKKCKCKEGAPEWVVTFGDMMSLLLTFFVLLLSFAEMDVQKFKEMSGKLEKAFGVQRTIPVQDMPKGIDLIARDFNPKFSVDELMEKIKAAIKTLEKGRIEVLKDMRGIVLRISDESFFDKSRTKLRPNAWPILDSIIEVARTVKNDISIEAHTDDEEYKNSEYPDSWGLSAERSLAITRYFVRFGNINGNRLNPVARGDSIPLVENKNATNRRMNRRIEIVFVRQLDMSNDELNKMFGPTEGPRGKSNTWDPVEIFNLGK